LAFHTVSNLGDSVFGVPDYIGQPTGGAAEYAILKVFLPIPGGLDITEAAALPMAVETAARSIDLLPLTAGQTLMVNGGGTMFRSHCCAVRMSSRLRVRRLPTTCAQWEPR
jgi:NADPH:quinone reductase-like Zn-dependent oxidoreductase